MPADRLSVHLNREELHAVEVPGSFETTGSFDVELINHGASVHAHLHLDDALSEQAAVDAPNHHVDGNGERLVRVTRIGDGTARGKLKVVTAYGATTRYVDLGLTEPVSTDEPVIVGEELSKPQPRPTESSPFERRPEILVGVVLLLGLTVGTVALFQNAVLVLGVVVLVVGVVAALVAARSD